MVQCQQVHNSVWYFWDIDHQFSVTTAVQCLSFVLIIVHKISYHTPLSRPHVCEMFQVENVLKSTTVQRLILQLSSCVSTDRCHAVLPVSVAVQSARKICPHHRVCNFICSASWTLGQVKLGLSAGWLAPQVKAKIKAALTLRQDLPYKDTQEDENCREGNGKPPWQIREMGDCEYAAAPFCSVDMPSHLDMTFKNMS